VQTPRDHQPTFFDLAVHQCGVTSRVLETIAREVYFSADDARVSVAYRQAGRPVCNSRVLLRVMILQHRYGWSRQQTEAQLKDRLSFQKFMQLDAPEAVPDETTICQFRQRLIEGGLREQLLALLNTQLEARGYSGEPAQESRVRRD
jgi:IS5 family transposase